MNTFNYNEKLRDIRQEILEGCLQAESVKFIATYGYVETPHQKKISDATMNDIFNGHGYLVTFQDEILEVNLNLATEWLTATLLKTLPCDLAMDVSTIQDTHPVWKTLSKTDVFMALYLLDPELFAERVDFSKLFMQHPVHNLRNLAENENVVRGLYHFILDNDVHVLKNEYVKTYINYMTLHGAQFTNEQDIDLKKNAILKYAENVDGVPSKSVIHLLYDLLGDGAVTYVNTRIHNGLPVYYPPDQFCHIPDLEKYIIFSGFNGRKINLEHYSDAMRHELGKVMHLRKIKKLPEGYENYPTFLSGIAEGHLLLSLDINYNKYMENKFSFIDIGGYDISL